MKIDADWDGALRRRDPRELRRLLSLPIRVNKIRSRKRREKIIRDETARRERALHVLYSTPEDWPPEVRWQWIALHLAGERFAGCRTITKGLGGRKKGEEQKRPLRLQFDAYRSKNPNQSQQSAAANFMKIKENQAACEAVGLHDAKSFAQAMKKISI